MAARRSASARTISCQADTALGNPTLPVDKSIETSNSLPNLSWTDYVAPDLPIAIRQRGARYFALNRVRLTYYDAHRIQAEVSGAAQNLYEVSLKRSDRDTDALMGLCSCPHYQRGELCKHVWALCLTAQANNWPSPAAIEDDPQDTDKPAAGKGASSGTKTPLVRRLMHQSEKDERSAIRSLWNDIDPELEWTQSEQMETQLRSWLPDTRLVRELSSNQFNSRLSYSGPRQPQWANVLDRIEQRLGSDRDHGKPGSHRPLRIWFVINLVDSRAFGVLCLELWHQEQLLNGGWGRMRRNRLSRSELGRIQDPEQRRLLGQLLSVRPLDSESHDQSLDDGFRQLQLGDGAYEPVLVELAASGALVVDHREQNAQVMTDRDLQAIRWDSDGAWSMLVTARDATSGDGWLIEGMLRRMPAHSNKVSDGSAPATRPISDASLVLEDGLILIDSELTLLRDLEAPSTIDLTENSLNANQVLDRNENSRTASPVLTPSSSTRQPSISQSTWLKAFRRENSFEVKPADKAAFLERWWSLAQPAAVDFPPALSLEPVTRTPRPSLSIFGLTDGRSKRSRQFRMPMRSSRRRGLQQRSAARGSLRASLHFNYEEIRVSALDSRHAVPLIDDARVLQRDLLKEQAFMQALLAAGATKRRVPSAEQGEFEIPAAQFASLTRTLLDDDWIIEAENAPIRTGGSVKVGIVTNVDWFELTGELSFDGQSIALPEILRAAASGSFLVRLGDGSHGMLPEDWLARFGTLLGMGEQTEQGVRFTASQALLLDALLAAQSEQGQTDRGYQSWRERLQALRTPEPVLPGPSFKGELRAYQQEGLGWMQALARARVGGVLADDMGLGKTVQVLALLAAVHIDDVMTTGYIDSESLPSLVVVPRSLVFNWKAEATRFVPALRVLDYTGTAVERERQREEFQAHDLIITTYGTLRRDIGPLRKRRFRYVVLDEATAIKNPASQVAKVSRLIQAEHRLAMTGTPVENHLNDLWSLFEFLNPGLLGHSATFSELARSGVQADSELAQALGRAIRPFMLRRNKAQVLPDLPGKNEQLLYCQLGDRQRRAYEEVRNYYRNALATRVADVGLNQSKIQVLEALLRLRQMACHPALLDPAKAEDGSAKLEMLMERLQEISEGGHKALVFSQFTKLLAIVRRSLDREGIGYEYLDGSTRDRASPVHRFQSDPDRRVFLISLKAGGHGLNLTAADYVLILDPWWNPAVEAQAVDRAHRIGQTRNVMVYRLVSEGTVEEKILQLQSRKQALADAIISADHSLLQELSDEDLQLLLS